MLDDPIAMVAHMKARAQQIRQLAQSVSTANAKDALLRVADNFERRARELEALPPGRRGRRRVGGPGRHRHPDQGPDPGPGRDPGRDDRLAARGTRTHDLSVSAKARAFRDPCGGSGCPYSGRGQGRPIALPGLAAST